jgi:glycosyltransferase involved in cell wall biosynthesis
VELMLVERVPNRMVRLYQSQADIVVDQLLVGGGGQNARECLAVGRPVLTRVHPEQWAAFDRSGGRPPFVPTERHNLRENLVRLIEDEELRHDLGRASAEFARDVLSPESCARRYLAHYERLYEGDAA